MLNDSVRGYLNKIRTFKEKHHWDTKSFTCQLAWGNRDEAINRCHLMKLRQLINVTIGELKGTNCCRKLTDVRKYRLPLQTNKCVIRLLNCIDGLWKFWIYSRNCVWIAQMASKNIHILYFTINPSLFIFMKYLNNLKLECKKLL